MSLPPNFSYIPLRWLLWGAERAALRTQEKKSAFPFQLLERALKGSSGGNSAPAWRETW